MHLNKVENNKAEQEENRQEGGDVTLCPRLDDGELLKRSRNGLKR